MSLSSSTKKKWVNSEAAAKAQAEGQAAREKGNFQARKAAVRTLWKLRVPDEVKSADDRASASGLRGRP